MVVRKWMRTVKRPMLRVSTHWLSNGASLSMLVEDMLRNKCFFQVSILHVLRFVSVYAIFTDSS
jgi:hypothetical protein